MLLQASARTWLVAVFPEYRRTRAVMTAYSFIIKLPDTALIVFLQQTCAAEAVFEGGTFAVGFEDAGEAGLILGRLIFVFAQFVQVAEELRGLVIGFGAFLLAERRDLFPCLFLTGG